MTSPSEPFNVIGCETEHRAYDGTEQKICTEVMSFVKSRPWSYGVMTSTGMWTRGGGRSYVDANETAESATPECTDGRTAMLHEYGGSLLWAVFFRRYDEMLRRSPTVRLMKVNSSRDGDSAGCSHINVCMPVTMSSMDTQRVAILDQIKAFLVSLQLLTGTGMPVPLNRARTLLGTPNYGFAISPRAFHTARNIGPASSSSADGNKPLMLNRDEPHMSKELKLWRMQLCAHDSNILPTALELKLDLLLIISEMAAKSALKPVTLIEPKSGDICWTARRVSLNWRQHLEVAGRPSMTPLMILRDYLSQAQRYVENEGGRHRTGILERFEGILAAFDTDENIPRELFGKVDWVTKAVLLERKEEALLKSRLAPLTYLQAETRHFNYHQFWFPRDSMCTPLSLIRRFGYPGILRDSWRSLFFPPTDTRAYARGMFVGARPSNPIIDWEFLKYGGLKPGQARHLCELDHPAEPYPPNYANFMAPHNFLT